SWQRTCDADACSGRRTKHATTPADATCPTSPHARTLLLRATRTQEILTHGKSAKRVAATPTAAPAQLSARPPLSAQIQRLSRRHRASLQLVPRLHALANERGGDRPEPARGGARRIGRGARTRGGGGEPEGEPRRPDEHRQRPRVQREPRAPRGLQG